MNENLILAVSARRAVCCPINIELRLLLIMLIIIIRLILYIIAVQHARLSLQAGCNNHGSVVAMRCVESVLE